MFPLESAARDRFILSRRRPRQAADPWRAHGVALEDERTADGRVVAVATVFLTGRECPWRCTMCDLWQYTTETDTPAGAIAAQVAAAGEGLDPARDVRHVKLYNAGSFFDRHAVPPADYDAIARSLHTFDRVIVESHPSLVGRATTTWIDAMARAAAPASPPVLEVAMGLETVHPTALDALNKRMTVTDFRQAAGRLVDLDVDLRVFLLVSPPFVPADEQDQWLIQSVQTAIDCGATVVSLIPTREGNGTVDALAAAGLFAAPTLDDVERSFDLAMDVAQPAGTRVFVDLWDVDRLTTCPQCAGARRARLHATNLSQRPTPPVACDLCGHAA